MKLLNMQELMTHVLLKYTTAKLRKNSYYSIATNLHGLCKNVYELMSGYE